MLAPIELLFFYRLSHCRCNVITRHEVDQGSTREDLEVIVQRVEARDQSSLRAYFCGRL